MLFFLYWLVCAENKSIELNCYFKHEYKSFVKQFYFWLPIVIVKIVFLLRNTTKAYKKYIWRDQNYIWNAKFVSDGLQIKTSASDAYMIFDKPGIHMIQEYFKIYKFESPQD